MTKFLLSTLFFGLYMVATAQCQADFTYTINNGTVDFTNTSTGGALFYYWDFGDGNNSYQENPSNTYATSDNYLVCLTIYDSLTQCQSTYCDTFYVAADTTQCQASFTYTINNGTVDFTNTSTSGALFYYWDFGDGNNSYQENPSNTYATSNNYLVCLTIYDSLTQCQSTYCDTFYVAADTTQCQASFTYTINNGTVDFTNTSTSGALFYYWDFGDGNNSYQENPSNTYATSDNYLVCLTIYDSLTQCQSTYCDTLYVAADTNQCQASFTYTINNGTVDFTNTSTSGALFYYWDFGDGNNSYQENPSNTYATSDNYLVCLTIYDSLTQCQSTYCDTFYVAADTTGSGCNPVSNVYHDGNGNIVGTASGASMYYWGVFDASWNFLYNTSSSNLNYTPGSNGLYNVCLTTYDSMQNFCDSMCYQVNVMDTTGGGGTGCNTVSDVYLDSNGVIVGTASGAAAYEWAIYDINWIFLYGSNGTNINYTPASNGLYTVCLVTYDTLWNVCDSICYNIGVFDSTGVNGCNVSVGVTMDTTGNIVGTASGGVMYHWIVFDDSWNYLYDSNNNNLVFAPSSPGGYNICLTTYDSLQYVCDSTCFFVFSNSLASIADEEEIVFDVYPNPTRGIVHLELSNDLISEVILVDMTGSVILQKEINEATTEIDLGNFPKGMYFIHALGRKGQRLSSSKVLRQ